MPRVLVLVDDRFEHRALRLAVAAPVRPQEQHHRLALELGERRRLRSEPLLRASIGNAGWPSRLEQVHVLVEAHDDRGALVLLDLALQVHDRFRAAALSGQRQRLHFDRRAERDRQPRLVIELARLQLLFDDLVGARGVGHRLVVALRAPPRPRPSHENASIAIGDSLLFAMSATHEHSRPSRNRFARSHRAPAARSSWRRRRLRGVLRERGRGDNQRQNSGGKSGAHHAPRILQSLGV